MVSVIIDTGASIFISPNKTDFIGPLRPVKNVTLKNIASGLEVAGIGTLCYTFIYDMGKEQSIKLKQCLYVPTCSICLLCS
jgi:hypothetical protein